MFYGDTSIKTNKHNKKSNKNTPPFRYESIVKLICINDPAAGWNKTPHRLIGQRQWNKGHIIRSCPSKNRL